MKKFVSILLAVILVASAIVTVSAYSVYPDGKTSEQAIKDYEAANGAKVKTNRYYFQMPNGKTGPTATADVVYNETNEETGETTPVVVCKKGEKTPTWYNDFTQGAGVYWWTKEAACESWAGYRAMVEDADQSIYYADVPAGVVCFVWNNGVDGGTDKSQPIYYMAAQTGDVASEYPGPKEYASIPEGADSFDGMIAVVDPDKVDVNALSKKMTCGYNWYFYYGDGCYGSYATTSKNFTSIEENCLNPDHNHKYLRGDTDGDGTVTIVDATLIQRNLAKLSTSAFNAQAADADADGNVTIMDATRIQNVLVGNCDIDGNKPAK